MIMSNTDEPPAKRMRSDGRNARGSSCRTCRTRKLKCDGTKPRCGRCAKAVPETECVYDLEKDDHPHEDRTTLRFKSAVQGTPRTRDTTLLNGSPTATRGYDHSHGENERIVVLEQQVKDLQKALAASQSREIPRKDTSSESHTVSNVLGLHSVDHPIEPYIEIGEESRHSLLGQDASFRTFFWGSGYWGLAPRGGLLPEHEAFISETRSFKSQHATLRSASKELKRLERLKKAAVKQSLTIHNEPFFLRNLLPPYDEMEKLIDLYFDSIDSIYHVLHRPQFGEQYETYWQQSAESRSNSSFLCIILLCMACVMCVETPTEPKWIGDSSAQRTRAVTYILACDDFLQNCHSQKYLTLQYFQAKCLLQIAKMITGVHIKRWYIETGALLRLAISVGMHLTIDGSKLGGILSDFDKEMRRLLWAVICELELSVCLVRGLPSILDGLIPTCDAPKMLRDEDLRYPSQTTDELPTPAANPRHYPVANLVAAAQCRDLRMKLHHRLNDPTFRAEIVELAGFEEEMGKALQTCEPPQNISAASPTTAEMLSTMHLRMSLYRSLLLLNRHASMTSKSDATRRYASMRCTTIARSMILEHKQANRQTQLILTFLQAPIFMAALSLCLDLVISASGPPIDALHNSEELLDLIESALHMLELRALQVGGVYRRYWLLLAALAAIRARLHPEHAKEIDERAAEKLTSVLYKIISSQVYPSVAIPLPPQPLPLPVVGPEVDAGLYDQNLMDMDFGYANFDLGDFSQNLPWDAFMVE